MSAPGWRRAPAEGAPSRYDADLDLKVACGRSAAALPHRRPRSAANRANLLGRTKPLPPNPKSVTHVPNLKCYLCIDWALGITWSLVLCHWSFCRKAAVLCHWSFYPQVTLPQRGSSRRRSLQPCNEPAPPPECGRPGYSSKARQYTWPPKQKSSQSTHFRNEGFQ